MFFSERKDFITAEDYEYWIRLAQFGEFYFIDEVLGQFHIHNENASGDIIAQANASIAVKEYHFGLWLEKFPGKINTIHYGRSRMWVGTGASYIKVKNFEEGLKYALKAIRVYPWYWKAWILLLLGFFKIKIN